MRTIVTSWFFTLVFLRFFHSKTTLNICMTHHGIQKAKNSSKHFAFYFKTCDVCICFFHTWIGIHTNRQCVCVFVVCVYEENNKIVYHTHTNSALLVAHSRRPLDYFLECVLNFFTVFSPFLSLFLSPSLSQTLFLW